MTQRKVTSVTLILLLICATCIAPALAGATIEVTTDGVHLTQSDDSPTKLDANYYRVDSAYDFVVDGNQNYWVRIGSVKASRLSKNDYAALVCKGAIIIGAAGIAYAAAPAIAAGGGVTLTIGGISLTATANGITALVGGAIGFVADEMTAICTEFEKWFVDNRYRVVASDGTMLLMVQKTNIPLIQELKKDGLDISRLTHFRADGARMGAGSRNDEL